MAGSLWSFVLGIAPVRRAMQRVVNHEVDLAWQQAHEVLNSDRARTRTALSEAQRRVAELDAVNENIANELLALKAAKKHRQEQQVEFDAEQDQNTTSDLFCCLDCSSLWLLSARPDQRYELRRPTGKGCSACNDETLLRLMVCKAEVIESGDFKDVARPRNLQTEQAAAPKIPGHPTKPSADLRIKFVADLFNAGADTAIAKAIAYESSKVVRQGAARVAPADGCAGLSAIADGLDQVPKVIRNGVAWCATALTGMPEFPAKVLGEVVARAVLPLSLHGIAQGIRMVGAASCAADNKLGRCQCARHLATTGIAELIGVGELTRTIDSVTGVQVDIHEAPTQLAPIEKSRAPGIDGIGGLSR